MAEENVPDGSAARLSPQFVVNHHRVVHNKHISGVKVGAKLVEADVLYTVWGAVKHNHPCMIAALAS